MYKRPFTAICQKYGETKAVSVDVPDGKENALASAKEQLPDQNIVALIPGQHARNVYTYDHPSNNVVRPDTNPGGPWPENLPPGF